MPFHKNLCSVIPWEIGFSEMLQTNHFVLITFSWLLQTSELIYSVKNISGETKTPQI